MKKTLLILLGCLLLTTYNATAQELPIFGSHSEADTSQWGFNNNHQFTMNYNTFGQSVAEGVWQGTLGYATGMWLSGNDTKWGVIGSLLAVNIPILLDNDYNHNEVWVGKNLGAVTMAVSLTFSIEMYRKDKSPWNLPFYLVRR